MIPIGTKDIARENKKTRPIIGQKKKRFSPPKDPIVKNRLIHCPRYCKQTPSGYPGAKTYDPIQKHCFFCGLTK